MRTIRKEKIFTNCFCLIIGIIFTLYGYKSIAQYPVRSQISFLPPYSPSLSDYYTGTTERFVVTLTNTDFGNPLRKVRLRLNIKSNAINLRSKDYVYYPIVELDAGIPTRLSLSDLAPYFNPNNIDASGVDYNFLSKSSQLPDGYYTFRFDVIDANTGQVLNNTMLGEQNVRITTNDPPLLNLPQKGDNLAFRDPINIIFNWTPRHIGISSAEYEFSLYEINDNGMPPENAPFTSQPIYQATTPTTTLLYGPTEPQLLPSKKYAWRIKVTAMSGGEAQDLFRNNGYSETYWFQLNDNCPPVQQVAATVKNGAVTISWLDNPQMYEYTIEYRKKGNDFNRWFTTTTRDSRVVITNVSENNSYEYRVGGTCTIGAGATFSDVKAFTIPPRDSLRDKQCGIMPNINLSNQKSIETLIKGDVVNVGDFPVMITDLSSTIGSFSGKGYITIPFLGDVRVKVTFNNVVFNTDKQLIQGFMVTTYDSTGKQIADVDEIFEGGGNVGKVKTGLDTADVTFNFPIRKPEDIKVTVNADGTAIINVTGANGETKQVRAGKLPTTIKDSEGNIYNVDKDGKVTKVGKAAEIKDLDPKQLDNLQTDKAVVQFVNYENKQQYAFDQWKDVYSKSQLFKEQYQDLNGYRVSAKAIEAGKTDVVKAKVDIKDNSVKADSIRFVTSKGTRYESKSLGNNEYEITVVGGPAKDAQELYAIYPTGDNKYLSFGKLLIASYPHKKQKLILVPVNGASINKDEISKQLNSIYNKVAVEWDVQRDINFDDKTWDKNNNGLDVDGSGLFSTLTDEMKALNNAYRSKRTVEKSTIYLFVLPKASQAGVVGDMPRNKQFGYLFSSDGKVAAHEVGHGLFHLKHTFDGYFSGTDLSSSQNPIPNNVMSYPNGDQFAKLQWDAIHDPGLVIGVFEGDGDGLSKTYPSLICINDVNTNKFQSIVFSDPDGNPIDIGNAKPYAFYSQREKDISIQGKLAGFKKNGKIYAAWVNTETDEFAGYAPIDIDPKRLATYVLQLPKGEASKVQIVEGSGDNCEIKIKVNGNEVRKFTQDACTDCPGIPQYEDNVYRGKEKSGTKNSAGVPNILDYSTNKEGKQGLTEDEKKQLKILLEELSKKGDVKIKLYVINPDNPNAEKARQAASAEGGDSSVCIAEINDKNSIKFDFKFNIPWLNGISINGPCTDSVINAALTKLQNNPEYKALPRHEQIANQITAAFYKNIFGAIYCWTKEENFVNSSDPVKFLGGTLNELLTSFDIEQIFEGIVTIFKETGNVVSDSYTTYFKDLATLIKEAKAGKTYQTDAERAELIKKLRPPTDRMADAFFEKGAKVAKAFWKFYIVDGNTYRYGQVTVMAIPIVLTAGEWLTVKASTMMARITKFGSKADEVVHILADAEKNGTKIINEADRITEYAAADNKTLKVIEKKANGEVEIKDFEVGNAGKIFKVGDNIGGKIVQQVKNGTNNKVAIIGRKMDGHVIDAGNSLSELGYDVELFGGRTDLTKKLFKDQLNESFNINGKSYTWAEIENDFKTGNYKKDPVTGYIPDSELPNTLMYKANKIWAEKLKSQGYTIIDIGYPQGQTLNPSLFYNMELNTIFN